MDTGSPAYLRSMALNSKRARGDKDLPPTHASSHASRTAHRLFPDGGLLEYSEFSLPLLPHTIFLLREVDDRAISNEFISLVLAKTHSAIANFTDRAQDEDSLCRAISETRLEMISVIHKLHIFSSYWEVLNKEYASLKASLASFCTEKAPESIPLPPDVEI